MRDCAEIKELLFLYSDRLLEKEDATACSLHLESCAPCRAEYDDILRLNQEILGKQPVLNLPDHLWAGLKQHIFKKIKIPRPQKNILALPRLNWYRVFAAAAVLVLVLSAAWFSAVRFLGSRGTADAQQVRLIESRSVAQIISVASHSTVLLKPNSRIQLEQPDRDRVRIRLLCGDVNCMVEKHFFKEYSVSTPVADIRVMGTSFAVSLLRPEAALFSVFEGRVKIVKDGRERILEAGRRLLINGSEFAYEESAVSREAQSLFNRELGILQERQGRGPAAFAGRRTSEQGPAPDNIITEGNRGKLFYEAQSAQQKRNYAHSLDLYLKYLSEYPNDAKTDSCWDGIATNYLFLKKHGLAIDYFSMILRKSHSQELIENSYREVWGLCLRMRNNPRAVAFLEEYAGQRGLNTYRQEALFALAQIYREEMQDNFRAAAMYKAYLQEFGDSGDGEDACYYAGLCLEKLQRQGEAAHYFNAYLQKYPSGKWADRIRKITNR